MEKETSLNKRNSNIELLRVLSMLMIVAYHYAIMGFYAEDIMYSSNKSFVDIFGMGGKIGTDVFVMISGYYMVHSRLTLKKLLKLMGQLWFYTLGVLLVYVLVKGTGVLNFSLIKLSFFPLLSSHYWFASYYVILLFLSPFINAMLHNIGKRQHALLALLLFGLCSLLPEFFGIRFADGSLWLFVALYVTAAWFGLYVQPGKRLARICLAGAGLMTVLCAVKISVSNSSAQLAGDSVALEKSVDFLGAYSPFAFFIAALLVLGFICLEARQDRLGFVLGSASFGVYLFHANIIVGEHLYQDILHTAAYAEHPLLFVHALCSVLCIYLAGTLLDLVRQKSFAPLWDRLTSALTSRFEKSVIMKK